MTYADYSKNTATGGGGNRPIQYAEYMDAYMYSWAPTAGFTPGTPRPTLIRFHGGGGTNVPIFEQSRKNPDINQLTRQTADYFTDRGWGVINVEYGNGGPPGRDQALSPFSTGWGLISLGARAIQFARDNAADSSIWGFEIAPDDIIPWGNSFGAWISMMTQFVPTDWFAPYTPQLGPQRDRWAYNSTAKCKAQYNNGGPAAFTMIDPAVTVANPSVPPATKIFSGQSATLSFFDSVDRYRPSDWVQDPGGGPGGDPFGFAQIPAKRLQSLSPVFMLGLGDTTSRVPTFSGYPAQDVIGGEIVYDPETMPITDPVTGSTGPDDPFQGSVLAYAMQQLGMTYQDYGGTSLTIASQPWRTGTFLSSTQLPPLLFAWLTSTIGITA